VAVSAFSGFSPRGFGAGARGAAALIGAMRRGLSLAELVVALAIVAVATAVTLPSVGGLLDWIAVNTAAQDVATALAAARNAAVMQGSRTRLTNAPDTLRIDRWRGDPWDAVLRWPRPVQRGTLVAAEV